ncbi:MAG: nuclear transport factor 2 family protein [Acidobacteriota bacterium]
MGWLVTPERFLRPEPRRLGFLLVAAAAFLATEFGRRVYRPWVRANGIEDLGLADSVGNLGGIVVQIFLTVAAVNATRRQSARLAVFLACGYVAYEIVQPMLPRGTFDWKDVVGTAVGLCASLVLLRAFWHGASDVSDGAEDGADDRAARRGDSEPVRPQGVEGIVLAFVDAINRRDVEAIAGMLCDDHLFIDSGGAEHRGREQMRHGWAAYLAMVPDYAIAVERTLVSGDTVVILGTASGTYAPDGALLEANRWSTPAAWRAEVRCGRVAVWQVFADNEPIRRLMRRAGGDEDAAGPREEGTVG